MEEYDKVVGGRLRFKGAVLPVKEKSKKKKSKKGKGNSGIEKLIIKPGEEKSYHAVIEPVDRRTEAEKRFDARMSEQEKEFIEKRTKMTYQEIIDEYNEKLDRQSDHNEVPRVAAAGLG